MDHILTPGTMPLMLVLPVLTGGIDPGLQTAIIEWIGWITRVIALILAVSIAWSFLEGMIGHATDNPTMVNAIVPRILAVIVCLILAIAAVPIANAIIDSLPLQVP